MEWLGALRTLRSWAKSNKNELDLGGERLVDEYDSKNCWVYSTYRYMIVYIYTYIYRIIYMIVYIYRHIYIVCMYIICNVGTYTSSGRIFFLRPTWRQ